jgi:4-hydroxy-3-polyprenylbenzoate decarboxylase
VFEHGSGRERINAVSEKSYRSLGDYLETLEERGLLLRISEPVNKDTELHPLVRLQYRGLPEAQRRAFLFENVVDSRGNSYDIPVAVGCVAGSRDIYAAGLRCRPEEIPGRWAEAYANPITPSLVNKGECQEIVLEGKALEDRGLDLLPIPISTPGFDNAPYTSASQWITKDPETGCLNMGIYRGQLKAPDRLGCHVTTPSKDLGRHWHAYRKLGKREMPVAIVIGVPPHLTYTAGAKVPAGISEYDISGGLAGAPVEVVKCRTVDLMVPSQAEIVIEGVMPTDALELEGPFGEFAGYMANRGFTLFMEVTCITHRRQPIYEAMLSQVPPSESSKIRQIGQEASARRVIEQDLGYSGQIKGIHFPESGGSLAVCIISFKKKSDDEPMKVLEALHKKRLVSKLAIVVDEDINAQDLDSVVSALAFRMQPARDMSTVPGVATALDPSIMPPSEKSHVDILGASKLEGEASVCLIDATCKWPYPPVSLPAKEFMEGARQLWERLDLPPLELSEPWFGYSMGYWSEEEEEEAELAVKGEYYKTGEIFRKSRRKV